MSDSVKAHGGGARPSVSMSMPMSTPRQIFIESPTVTLAGWEYGNEDAQPMVFLHGLTDLAWSLHPVAAAFADQFRVLNFDLRGHGDSSHPGRYTAPHFISDLRLVIDQLDLNRPILFGHSMGSIITSSFAGMWPDEPALLIMAEGLGPPPRVGDATAAGHIEITKAFARSVMSDPTRRPMSNMATAQDRLRKAHAGLTDQQVVELTEAGTRPGADGGLVWKWDPFVREWAATFDRVRYEELWAAITCPTLVLTGGQAWDRWWKPTDDVRPGPSFTGEMTALERDRRLARFVDVEHYTVDGGHMIHFDVPQDVISRTRDFVSRRLPETSL